jgi:repressor of nif and glnA expression
MTEPQIERKLIEIMRVISESDKPIGARNIADELNNRGYGIGERAVRYHLRILDERGFTKKYGYAGRTITELGRKELDDALIGDRLGFVITRIEELIYKTNYDLKSKEGDVIINISYLDKDDFDDAVAIMKYAAESGVVISPRVRVFEEDSDSDIYVPPGKIGIATVCSITFDGLLLKNGIPVKTSYGGILQIENQENVRFLDLISYNGTSIDPIKIFLNRHSTSVLDVMEKGTGRVLANMRQIPASAREKANEVLKLAEESNISGAVIIGESGEELFGAPVDVGRSGIPVIVGINAIAAVEEAGIEVVTHPVSTVLEYNTMSAL